MLDALLDHLIVDSGSIDVIPLLIHLDLDRSNCKGHQTLLPVSLMGTGDMLARRG